VRRPDEISLTAPSERRTFENTPEPSLLRIKQRKRNWVPISRALIDDARLQFDTRGVANWLIAKPDGWQIRLSALPYLLQQRAGPNERMGRDRVRRILRELERAGYLSRARSKKSDGRWVWRIEFSDSPASLRREPSTMDGSAVDGQGVDITHTVNNSRPDKSIPTTTTAAGDAEKETVVVGPETEIQYRKILQGDYLASARKLIDGCPAQYRQPVLDEIGAMHAAGRVRSPLGLLRSLVDKAGSGQFVPSHSLSLRPKSTIGSSDAQGQHVLTGPHPASQPSQPMVLASDIGRKTLARLREKLRPDGS